MRIYLALGLLILATLPASAQREARTVPRALDQLTVEADTIVRGTVVSAKVEPHPKFTALSTVVVKLNVTQTLKGSASKTLEFRQFIWDIRDELDNAGYHKSEDVLLLLGPTSEYGLRSPVGLEQGRFRILTDRSGTAKAVNGRGNIGLFQGTEKRLSATGVKLTGPTAKLVHQQASGPIALNELTAAIQSFSGVAK
jgi:hypothetical protein